MMAVWMSASVTSAAMSMPLPTARPRRWKKPEALALMSGAGGWSVTLMVERLV
jgi:hypothetical protein